MSRKKEKEKPVMSVKERISSMFEMPDDVVLGSSKVTVVGNNQVNIENYGGILEYSDTVVRVKSSEKIIIVEGAALNINTMTDTDIYITGKVTCVRWG